MADLTGKYAVVTGGAKGIGAAVVKRYLDENIAGVAILDCEPGPAEALAAENEKVLLFNCDVSDEVKVKECIEKIHAAFGRIDILVNNAGIIRDAMFTKMSKEKWDKVLDNNLNGTFNCLHEVVPIMIAQNYGKIVNISSSSAHGNVGQANYSASKAAILGLTKTLAKELAAKGITANAVSPANIATDMFAQIPEKLLQTVLALTPIHRLGTPEELAAGVFFLSTDDSRYVTGIELPINGGMFT